MATRIQKTKKQELSSNYTRKAKGLTILTLTSSSFLRFQTTNVNYLFDLVKELVNWLMNLLKSSNIPFSPNHTLSDTQNHSTHVMSTLLFPIALTLNILHHSLSVSSIHVHVTSLYCTFPYNLWILISTTNGNIFTSFIGY